MRTPEEWAPFGDEESTRILKEQNAARIAAGLPIMKPKRRACQRCGKGFTSASNLLFCASCMDRLHVANTGAMIEH